MREEERREKLLHQKGGSFSPSLGVECCLMINALSLSPSSQAEPWPTAPTVEKKKEKEEEEE